MRILRQGEPQLKERARPVDSSAEDVSGLVADLAETMYDANGVGLAATQCGVMKRVVVFDTSEERNELHAVVNPEVVTVCDEIEAQEEGCLSVPDVRIFIERPCHVHVRGENAAGQPVEYEADELLARVLQHEIDHLDGILIVDRASKAERRRAIRQQREAAHARAGLPLEEPKGFGEAAPGTRGL